MKQKGKVIELSILVLALILVLSIKIFDAFFIEKPAYENLEVQSTLEDGYKSSEDQKENDKKVSAKLVKVYVSGAVKSAGVYELTEDQRIEDAIQIAGGFTEEADTESVNLADHIYDTQKIMIYKVGEKPQVQIENAVGKWTLQDLNEADMTRLTQLDGVGEVMAQKIIDYRNSNGPFNAVDELLQISGIGEKKLAKMKTAFADQNPMK